MMLKRFLALLLIANGAVSFVLLSPHVSVYSKQVRTTKPLQPVRLVAKIQWTYSQENKVSMHAKNQNDDKKLAYDDGSGRGSILFAIVTAFCIWQFTIPPSFRRAYICSTPTCIEVRSACGNCVTAQEWSSDVMDYYKQGGGIQWDFSIDPRTVEQNKQKWDEVFVKK